MNYIRHLNGFFARLAEDKRMSSYHISVYFALFQQWNADRFGEQFVISRTETMEMSRLGSVNTYARCMKELSQWGYIRYTPSSNIHSGSRVSCIRFDIGSDTAGSTTGDTGNKSDTAASTATDIASNTGTENDTACDIPTNTARVTGTSCNIKTDTGTGTTRNTGITADTENDTGRSTATGKNNPAGSKSDTGTDTAGDTLFINITNKNKPKEEESSKRNSKEKVEENPWEKSGEKGNLENLSTEKFQTPEIELIIQFFEKNHSSAEEAQRFYSHYHLAGWKTADMKTIVSWQAIAWKWIENNQNNRTDEREYNQVRTGKLSVTVNKNYDEPL